MALCSPGSGISGQRVCVSSCLIVLAKCTPTVVVEWEENHLWLPSAASLGRIRFVCSGSRGHPHILYLSSGTHIKEFALESCGSQSYHLISHRPAPWWSSACSGRSRRHSREPTPCPPAAASTSPPPPSFPWFCQHTIICRKSFCLKYLDPFLFYTLNSDPYSHHQCQKTSIFPLY